MSTTTVQALTELRREAMALIESAHELQARLSEIGLADELAGNVSELRDEVHAMRRALDGLVAQHPRTVRARL